MVLHRKDHIEFLLRCVVDSRPVIQPSWSFHIMFEVGFIERVGLAVQSVLVEVLADRFRDGLFPHDRLTGLAVIVTVARDLAL